MFSFVYEARIIELLTLSKWSQKRDTASRSRTPLDVNQFLISRTFASGFSSGNISEALAISSQTLVLDSNDEFYALTVTVPAELPKELRVGFLCT